MNQSIQSPRPTRQSDMPEVSPWFGWTDADFAAFEATLLLDGEPEPARLRLTEAEMEALHAECEAMEIADPD